MSEKKYTCVDCGAKDIRPFSNGDGTVRCKSCAVKKYKKLPYSSIQLRAALELAQGIGRNNCLDSCSFVKMHREVTKALQILQGKVLVDRERLIATLRNKKIHVYKKVNYFPGVEHVKTISTIEEQLAHLTERSDDGIV